MRLWRSLTMALMLMALAAAGRAATVYDGSALRGVDARIWGGIAATNWIAQGDGERIVYAFIDPNCPYSRALFRKAQAVLDPGKVQIRWIPVGVLPRVTEDSRRKAAAALRGGRGELNTVMTGGGPMTRPIDGDLRHVDDSARFMQQEIGPYVAAGVPKLVYIRDPGNELRVFVGVPGDAELAKVMR